MMKLIHFAIIILLFIAACNSPPENEQASETNFAEAVIAEVTRIAASQPVTPTFTPLPTSTLTETPMPTQTPIPTKRFTNTPKATPTPVTGTFNNPYPYGMNAPLSYNDVNLHFQIVDVIRGYEANSIVKLANMFNEDPPEGMEYVLVRINLEYSGGEGALKVSDSYFSSISSGNVFGWLDVSACCLQSVNYPELEATLISPGAKADGWIARFVFIDDPKPMIALLQSNWDDINEGIFWAITP